MEKAWIQKIKDESWSKSGMILWIENGKEMKIEKMVLGSHDQKNSLMNRKEKISQNMNPVSQNNGHNYVWSYELKKRTRSYSKIKWRQKKNGFRKYVESKETRDYCTSRSPRYNDKKTNAMAAKNVI